jgi:Holliday junction DNA helicase RuvA
MIGFLKGTLQDLTDGRALVFVEFGSTGGSGSGVGYSVAVPGSAEYSGLVIGQPISFFVHTHVREDALDLYAFKTSVEREMFLTLLTVNGIGPKGALGVLTRVSLDQLIRSILEDDKASLTEIPGIGKKTAERIVLELGSVVQKKIAAGSLSYQNLPKNVGQAISQVSARSQESQVMRDARDALLGLGYRENDVQSVFKKITDDGSLSVIEQPTAQDWIKQALKRIS